MHQKHLFVLLSLFIIAELGLAIFSILSVRQSTIDKVTAQTEHLELLTAQAVANSLESDTSNVQQGLSLLALTPEIRNGNPQICQEALSKAAIILNGKINNLSRLNNQAKIDCSIDPAAIGSDRSSQPHVQTIFQDPEHHPVLSRVIFSIGQNLPSMTMHVPIFDQKGQFAGTLVATIHLQKIQDGYLQPIKLLNTGYITLLDDNGDILYHPQSKIVGSNILSQKPSLLIDNDMIQKLTTILSQSASQPTGSKYFQDAGKIITAWDTANVFPDRRWVVITRIPQANIVDQLIDTSFQAGSTTWLNISLLSALSIISLSTLIALILEVPLLVQIFTTLLSRLTKSE